MGWMEVTGGAGGGRGRRSTTRLRAGAVRGREEGTVVKTGGEEDCPDERREEVGAVSGSTGMEAAGRDGAAGVGQLEGGPALDEGPAPRSPGAWGRDCRKQVYMGGFDTDHAMVGAYDQATIKFRGVDADINFDLSDYDDDLKQMRNLMEELEHILCRQSTRSTLHKCGCWEARNRMGQLPDKK
ncbi:hypothetical protein HHK36_008131 [Tetracentron sinense]|uniref:AP2/ERF domain-containing protein n=1 Tax=Tetracentron sinense TaxID=13715 RepID=A0A835DJR7_TETSI|nr:hypothetical protein HHK36_008131 [Tetracentron sinense]